MKKDVKFEWGDEQKRAFLELKEKLVNSPILQYPDFSKEFFVTTDASNNAIGAVLSQKKNNEDLPVAYASRTLNKAECNYIYSTIEKELLAVAWAVHIFRPHIERHLYFFPSDLLSLFWHV